MATGCSTVQNLALTLRPKAVAIVNGYHALLREKKWFGSHLPANPPMIIFFNDQSFPAAYYDPRNGYIRINLYNIMRIKSVHMAVAEAMATYACHVSYNMAVEMHKSAINVRTAMRPVMHGYKSAKWTYYYDHFMAAIK